MWLKFLFWANLKASAKEREKPTDER